MTIIFARISTCSAVLLSVLLFLGSPLQAFAAVAFDAVSESDTGTAGVASVAAFSWSHVPVGKPAGVLVFTFVNANADDATSVTYGGKSLTKVPLGRAVDSVAGENGDAEAWFLGSGLPVGSSTVLVNRTNNSDVMYAVAITVTAKAGTTAVGATTTSEDAIPKEVNVDDSSPGTNSLRFAGAQDGASAVPAAGANSTAAISIDFGLRVITVVRETTAGQGSRGVGFDGAGGNDDYAAVYLAISEIQPTRRLLLFEGYKINLISGKIILNQSL